jgi:hypothetical protein
MAPQLLPPPPPLAAAGGRHKPWLQLWDASPVALLHTCDLAAYGACHALTAIPWPADLQPSRYPSNFSSGVLPRVQPGQQHAKQQQRATWQQELSEEQQQQQQQEASPGWRLVTGHDSGQLLLWHPCSHQLQPIMKIEGSSSSVRGIMVFESCGLMCTGHANGDLVIFKQLAMDLQVGAVLSWD